MGATHQKNFPLRPALRAELSETVAALKEAGAELARRASEEEGVVIAAAVLMFCRAPITEQRVWLQVYDMERRAGRIGNAILDALRQAHAGPPKSPPSPRRKKSGRRGSA